MRKVPIDENNYIIKKQFGHKTVLIGRFAMKQPHK